MTVAVPSILCDINHDTSGTHLTVVPLLLVCDIHSNGSIFLAHLLSSYTI